MTVYEILLVACADRAGWRARVSFSQRVNNNLVQRSEMLRARGTRTGALIEVDNFIEDPDGYLEKHKTKLEEERRLDLRGYDPK